MGNPPIIPKRQLDLAMASFFEPQPDSGTPNQLVLKAGIMWEPSSASVDKVKIIPQQTTSAFAVVSGPNKVRWDLVSLNNLGQAIITAGTEVSSLGVVDFSGAPGSPYPTVPGPSITNSQFHVRIAYVKVTEDVTVVVSDSDITDVRQIFTYEVEGSAGDLLTDNVLGAGVGAYGSDRRKTMLDHRHAPNIDFGITPLDINPNGGDAGAGFGSDSFRYASAKHSHGFAGLNSIERYHPADVQINPSNFAQISVPKGVYAMSGYRYNGRFSDPLNPASFDLAVDTTPTLITTYITAAGFDAGLVASNWYAVFMDSNGNILVYPYIRVKSYNTGTNVLKTGAHLASGTDVIYASAGAETVFTGLRGVVISGTDRGSLFTTLNGVDGTTYNTFETDSSIANLVAGDWLLLYPPSGTNFTFLCSVFSNSGATLLRGFTQFKFKMHNWGTIAKSVYTPGTLTSDVLGSNGYADLAGLVSPIATHFDFTKITNDNMATGVSIALDSPDSYEYSAAGMVGGANIQMYTPGQNVPLTSAQPGSGPTAWFKSLGTAHNRRLDIVGFNE